MRRNKHSAIGAFTLIEVVIASTISALITVGIITFFSTVLEEVRRPVVTYGSANYALAPIIRNVSDGVSKTDILDALDLNLEFVRKLNGSDLVVVFGGANATTGAPPPPNPLVRSFSLTSLSTLTNISPASLLTAQDVMAAASTQLAGNLEPTPTASDFTVLIFEGIDQITGIAQVRRFTSTYESKAIVLYETAFRSRTLPSTAWTTYAYRFWIPAEEDVWGTPIGAVHSWFRFESNWWSRKEPAGATLILPDPYVLSVAGDNSAVRPQSRFAYFVPTSPAY